MSNSQQKYVFFEIGILNTQWKDCKSCKNLCRKKFTITNVHKIAAVNLSKIYFLRSAKKKYKPNTCDLKCDWIKNREEINVWIGSKLLEKLKLTKLIRD